LAAASSSPTKPSLLARSPVLHVTDVLN